MDPQSVVPAPAAAAPGLGFRPADVPARWAVGTLAASGVIALISMILGLNEWWLIKEIQAGRFVSERQAEQADMLYRSAGLVQILALIGTAVAWCIWQHRAHRNLVALGSQGLVFTPGWAVGWWFVPIMNLFKPYQAIKELWQASDPASSPAGWKASLGTTPFLGLWWAAFLLSGLIGNIGARIPDDGLGQISASLYLLMFSDDLFIVAAFFAILLVRRINRRQEDKGRPAPSTSAGNILPT